MIGIILYKEAM